VRIGGHDPGVLHGLAVRGADASTDEVGSHHGHSATAGVRGIGAPDRRDRAGSALPRVCFVQVSRRCRWRRRCTGALLERKHAMKHQHLLGIVLGATLLSAAPAHAGEQTLRLSGFAAVGLACETTFVRNPAVIKDVDNVNIKIGGPYGTVPDPHYWHIDSPTVAMNDASTGLHIIEYDAAGNPEKEWHESNTAAHDGPFVPGTWTVSLKNTAGEDCAVYDDQVKVTFTLVP
jgi:hypothetical protein